MPPYASDFPEEQVAIDSYVFGGFKDENGIIPSLKKAKELIRLFARSPRRMEIIYYETTDEPDQGVVPLSVER